jgi:hypothetical protein
MKAVVVYESLWGNTAAVARAIAEGLGPDAQALSTTQADQEALTGIDLIVAGAPVHSLSLPTLESRELAWTGSLGPAEAPPDLSHRMLREWLAEMPRGRGYSAAFDTRVKAWYGRGAASKILQGLKRAGYEPLAQARGFFVSGHPIKPTTDGTLVKGEIERARRWGAELAKAVQARQSADLQG